MFNHSNGFHHNCSHRNTCTYIVISTPRKRLAYMQFEDTVQLIRNGHSGFQFSVFLSYLSENQAFVINYIHLQVGNKLALFINSGSMKEAILTILSDILILLKSQYFLCMYRTFPLYESFCLFFFIFSTFYYCAISMNLVSKRISDIILSNIMIRTHIAFCYRQTWRL